MFATVTSGTNVSPGRDSQFLHLGGPTSLQHGGNCGVNQCMLTDEMCETRHLPQINLPYYGNSFACPARARPRTAVEVLAPAREVDTPSIPVQTDRDLNQLIREGHYESSLVHAQVRIMQDIAK